MSSELLAGKAAIVSGVGSGMGVEHARALVREGACVIGFDIKPGEAPSLIEELGSEKFGFIQGDVRSQADWNSVVETCVSRFGDPSVLVNNAGVLGLHHVETISDEEYYAVIDINQIGTFLGMKAVIEPMRRQGGGSIINICSTSGLIAFPGNFAYVASKWAVRGMTKAAALELAKDRIRVNTVCPGETDTPLIQEDPTVGPPDALPFRRWARPAEIADAVVFLASDKSTYVSGSDLVVDGAYTAA